LADNSSRVQWIGRGISILPCLLFVFSAVIKLKGGPDLSEGFAHLGIPDSLALPLAAVELSCVAVYLIPVTSILGAILLTGFLGGAICAHLRVGDPFLVHIALGVLIWLGLWLREDRVRALIPLRRRAALPRT